MSATRRQPPVWRSSIPELHFEVLGAEPLEHAALPTVKFSLAISAPGGQPIRSVMLDAQIQIAARQRGYGAAGQERLLELFGTPDRWSTTLRTLIWHRGTLVVPPFDGSTVADLLVPCSYDLEVTASRYLAALDDGEVPLEFLFSGSVFFAAESGALQMARISWENDVEYRMPVAVWKKTMELHFPRTAWLRIAQDSFDRLCSYKARGAFKSWEEAIDSLLSEGGTS